MAYVPDQWFKELSYIFLFSNSAITYKNTYQSSTFCFHFNLGISREWDLFSSFLPFMIHLRQYHCISVLSLAHRKLAIVFFNLIDKFLVCPEIEYPQSSSSGSISLVKVLRKRCLRP